MPCPWKGKVVLECDNHATPIVDAAKVQAIAGDDARFKARLLEATTSDAGVCAAMTMKWCEQVYVGESGLTHPGATQLGLISTHAASTSFSPGDKVRKIHGDYNIEYARRLFAPVGEHEEHRKKRAAQRTMGAGLELKVVRQYKGPTGPPFLAAVRKVFEGGRLAFLSAKLNIQNQNQALGTASGWHAMGASPKGGAWSIFDPNWGLFEYGSNEEVIGALEAGMLNYFTRGGAAALQVREVKVASVGRSATLTRWTPPAEDALDALMAAFLRGP